MNEHTYRDTTWRAFLMGSEGWAVFAGPKMIASHLTEKQALLVEQAPSLLEYLQEALDAVCDMCKQKNPQHADCISCFETDRWRETIRKAEERII